MNQPSEVIRYLASFLKQNDSFVDTIYEFDKDKGKEYSYLEIDEDKLAQIIDDFYRTLK